VEKPKEVVNVGAGLELDVGGLDLGSALDALQQQEPAVAKEPIPAPSLGKKRGARPSAMSLFAGNGEQPEEAVAIAVAEAPLVPGSGSAAAFLRAPDSVKFSFAAVEEANLKFRKLFFSSFLF
jgi:hypothetical protein